MNELQELELKKETLEKSLISINDQFKLYDINKEIEEVKLKINDLLYNEVDNEM